MSYVTVALPKGYTVEEKESNRDRSQLMEWIIENDSSLMDELLYLSQMKKALKEGDFTISSSL
jgi:hypothetical protein